MTLYCLEGRLWRFPFICHDDIASRVIFYSLVKGLLSRAYLYENVFASIISLNSEITLLLLLSVEIQLNYTSLVFTITLYDYNLLLFTSINYILCMITSIVQSVILASMEYGYEYYSYAIVSRTPYEQVEQTVLGIILIHTYIFDTQM